MSDLSTGALMQTYKRWPVHFVSGEGCKLVDAEGREYLDLIAGLAVMSVGHSHPRVVQAIVEQTQKLIHVSNLYVTGPQVELSERLAALTGGYETFLCNSGAEAIECTLKLVRRFGGSQRTRVIAAEGGFHGRTMGALTVTGQPAKQQPFRPLLPGVSHVPYDDVSALEEAMDEDVAAVLLEPIQGEAGVVVPADDYFPMVRKICDEAGALLVVDEIQTGLGRTGRWFGFEHFGVQPDVICLAKALAGGLPIGACLAKPEVAAFQPGDHASTFGGGPVVCAAALAVLDVMDDEDLPARAAAGGKRFAEGLVQIFGEAAEVRGRGLLLGAEFETEVAHELTERALAKGVVVNNATAHVLRLAPPLIIGDEEIDRGLNVIKEVWDEVSAA